jgi:hypothetical protein
MLQKDHKAVLVEGYCLTLTVNQFSLNGFVIVNIGFDKIRCSQKVQPGRIKKDNRADSKQE